jgi:Tol biopolymer transport system component
VPANGGQPRLLAPEMLANPDFLAPAPDGKTLAVVAGGGRETWAHKQIVLVDLAGGDQTALTDEHTAALSPAWSPDGRQLAYTAAPDRDTLDDATLEADIAQRRIWLVGRDGNNKRQLTNDPSYRDERPRWSGNGRQLLFARIDAGGHASLWLADTAGRAPVQVADNLGPFPDDAPLPLGYYGHVDWDTTFDWWRGPAHAEP